MKFPPPKFVVLACAIALILEGGYLLDVLDRSPMYPWWAAIIPAIPIAIILAWMALSIAIELWHCLTDFLRNPLD